MVNEVAQALCQAAGRSAHDANDRIHPECVCCDKLPDGRLVCTLWTSFRHEARAAITAAHHWNKKNRRWPDFVE